MCCCNYLFSSGNYETVELTEYTVNPGQPKSTPQDFELLKLLGKGGYGKVRTFILLFIYTCLKKSHVFSYMSHIFKKVEKL